MNEWMGRIELERLCHLRFGLIETLLFGEGEGEQGVSVGVVEIQRESLAEFRFGLVVTRLFKEKEPALQVGIHAVYFNLR